MTITIHLPLPPSTNNLWRMGKTKRGRATMYKSKEYQEWIRRADIVVMAGAYLRGLKTITGKFDAAITVDPTQSKIDPDNAVKAILDAAQRWRIILNDKNLNVLDLKTGPAPVGCILTIKEAA